MSDEKKKRGGRRKRREVLEKKGTSTGPQVSLNGKASSVDIRSSEGEVVVEHEAPAAGREVYNREKKGAPHRLFSVLKGKPPGEKPVGEKKLRSEKSQKKGVLLASRRKYRKAGGQRPAGGGGLTSFGKQKKNLLRQKEKDPRSKGGGFRA